MIQQLEISVIDNEDIQWEILVVFWKDQNIEYYTQLSLLEQTHKFTNTRHDGFDRFKNGFVVDNFTGTMLVM